MDGKHTQRHANFTSLPAVEGIFSARLNFYWPFEVRHSELSLSPQPSSPAPLSASAVSPPLRLQALFSVVSLFHHRLSLTPLSSLSSSSHFPAKTSLSEFSPHLCSSLLALPLRFPLSPLPVSAPPAEEHSPTPACPLPLYSVSQSPELSLQLSQSGVELDGK